MFLEVNAKTCVSKYCITLAVHVSRFFFMKLFVKRPAMDCNKEERPIVVELFCSPRAFFPKARKGSTRDMATIIVLIEFITDNYSIVTPTSNFPDSKLKSSRKWVLLLKGRDHFQSSIAGQALQLPA